MYGLGMLWSVVVVVVVASFVSKFYEEKLVYLLSVKLKWVVVVVGVSVLFKFMVSIVGGGVSDVKVDFTFFGSTTSSTSLFGSSCSVIMMIDVMLLVMFDFE